ncbi:MULTISPECIES: tlde1 domain-containing protein [Pelistega]|uniref:tlde1 domain-containing protein n=1 Tax=Pelistega TaxID=106146 RepID=UPI00068ACB52|nr:MULTISPECIES: tlde1 domain-containing protein [Pelistega]
MDRPKGGIKSKTLTFVQDIYSGNNHEIWFALYRIDEQIDDYTIYNRVKRGNFRLHPSASGGTSWGCITFRHLTQFMLFRNALLAIEKKITIPNANIPAYGTVTVFSRTSLRKCDEESH